MTKETKKTEKTTNNDLEEVKTSSKKDAVKTAKTLSGVVVSDKMQDTVVVAVSRYVKHAKYKKYQKKVKKYHAHDQGNTLKVGDKVEIVETPPISKTKKFKVVIK